MQLSRNTKCRAESLVSKGGDSDCSFLRVSGCCLSRQDGRAAHLKKQRLNKEWFTVSAGCTCDFFSLLHHQPFFPGGNLSSAFTQLFKPLLLTLKSKNTSLGPTSSSSYQFISSFPSTALNFPSTHLRPHAFLIPSQEGFPILTLQLHGNELEVTTDFQGPKSVPQLVWHDSPKPPSKDTLFLALPSPPSLSLPPPPGPLLLHILSSRPALPDTATERGCAPRLVLRPFALPQPASQETSNTSVSSATEGCQPWSSAHPDLPSAYPNVYWYPLYGFSKALQKQHIPDLLSPPPPKWSHQKPKRHPLALCKALVET